MSVETLNRMGLAGDDGSGSAAFWDHARREMYGTDMYVMSDVGKRALGGSAAKSMFSPFTDDFHTDRQAAVRPSSIVTTQTRIGSEQYIG